ncbi:IS110 family transposase [Mycobacterium heckeshornense]|uniref:Transposase IS110-like N-terminal domain-containing protein n=1 Tax=Mycobacterium heckeshornense TaxID=110505 RepID=A0A7R7GPJ5_9MYCO|nr:hypothetical protein MHEC_01720 [Mycobacterium heckeshornense]
MSLAVAVALFFVGIDWAAESHAVCVMDQAGKVVARFTIAHSADGIATLIRRLAKYAAAEDVPIAIERPNGRLVDLLLEAGHPVVPVSPNAIKNWREGEVLSGAKSDAADAEVIAEYLRLRQHRLHVAAPYSDPTIALRTVVRTRTDLVEQRVAATHQLSALLDAHWPGAKALFADVESPISLAFLTRYPTPAAAMHLGEKRLAAFLGRLPPSLRVPRVGRRAGRMHTGHQVLWQTQGRALPLGLQQTIPPSHDHLRRQQPPRRPVGSTHLQPGANRRQRPPPCRPHPRESLDPRHLALLARRRPLRLGPTRRRNQTHRNRIGGLRLTQECHENCTLVATRSAHWPPPDVASGVRSRRSLPYRPWLG